MQIVNQIIRISKGYYVNVADLEAVMPLQAESTKKRITFAENAGKKHDLTLGKKNRSVIFLRSGAAIVTAIEPETIIARITGQVEQEEVVAAARQKRNTKRQHTPGLGG